MRRVMIVGFVLATAVIVAAVAFSVSGNGSPAKPVTASDRVQRSLRLRSDPMVTPAGAAALTPGGAFSYEFSVTNTGRAPVRRLAVRSEKVISARTGDGLRVRSISNPACSGTSRVDCLFPMLEPKETQTVRIEALSAAGRRPGDELAINTFLGTYAPGPGGGVAYDVIGERKVTTGTFGAAPRALSWSGLVPSGP